MSFKPCRRFSLYMIDDILEAYIKSQDAVSVVGSRIDRRARIHTACSGGLYKCVHSSCCMDGLRETIMSVLDVQRRGGTVVTRDSHTLILADYDYASHAGLSYITDQFPRTNITMSHCTSSSSGYIITFTRIYTPTVYTSSAFVHLLLTMVAIWTSVVYFSTNCLANFVE